VMARAESENAANESAAKSRVFISPTSSDMAMSAWAQYDCRRHYRNKQRGNFTVGVSNEESILDVALSFEPSCVRLEGLVVNCEREGVRSCRPPLYASAVASRNVERWKGAVAKSLAMSCTRTHPDHPAATLI